MPSLRVPHIIKLVLYTYSQAICNRALPAGVYAALSFPINDNFQQRYSINILVIVITCWLKLEIRNSKYPVQLTSTTRCHLYLHSE
jgi:hypothetical protein